MRTQSFLTCFPKRYRGHSLPAETHEERVHPGAPDRLDLRHDECFGLLSAAFGSTLRLDRASERYRSDTLFWA